MSVENFNDSKWFTALLKYTGAKEGRVENNVFGRRIVDETGRILCQYNARTQVLHTIIEPPVMYDYADRGLYEM